MAYRVEMSAQAERDTAEILEWLLSQHAEETGLRCFFAMEDAIASLEMFPKRCPSAPESIRFPFQVRQLLYGHKPHVYRILFTVEDDIVNILHIRHGRRKPL